jgi:hypothetical protein
MDEQDKIKEESWKDKGLDKFMERRSIDSPETAKYIGGANFDVLLDELLFNRMIKLKDLREKPQGNDPGKIYWDGENKKFKMWVNETAGWVDVIFTSTSTSTSSTSSSSSSTSSTSSSTSSTSSSTSSTSSSTSTT